jgi:glucose/arabinose dehydrogenase
MKQVLLLALVMMLRPAPATAAEPAVDFQRVFPRLTFERPLFLAAAAFLLAAPGDAQRLFVVGQGGLIHVFDARGGDPATAAVFLDLRRKVSRRGEEEGLLGLAFHPDYARNGRFYVYYSATGEPRQVIAQFRADVKQAVADPASERILYEVPDPYRNHNGGMLAFGPDGMLYIGSGDGGSRGDPKNNGQRLDTLLGKILRVTPDGTVPADNPFAGTAGARGEIWAYGLRNPWRFSFDRATGALWAGDVGQNQWEEIDVVRKGGNYGWRLFEGVEEFDNVDGRAAGDFIAPVLTYGRELGCSVTGGYVYRGKAVPPLQGHYLYADFCSGRVWAVPAEGKGGRKSREIASVTSPSSFGEDSAGELYVTSFDGGLYRLALRR